MGSLLPRGVFGFVKRVQHKGNQMSCAAKFIPLRSRTRTQAYRERDMLAELSHPLVTALLDQFETHKTLILVMELYPALSPRGRGGWEPQEGREPQSGVGLVALLSSALYSSRGSQLGLPCIAHPGFREGQTPYLSPLGLTLPLGARLRVSGCHSACHTPPRAEGRGHLHSNSVAGHWPQLLSSGSVSHIPSSTWKTHHPSMDCTVPQDSTCHGV